MPKKPDWLEGNVQKEILEPLGYFDRETRPDHTAYGLQEKKQFAGTQQMEFWYRQRSGDYMVPSVLSRGRSLTRSAISMINPSPLEPGMVSVRTDLTGKLIELLAMPNDTSSSKDDLLGKDAQLITLAGWSIRDFRLLGEEEERPANWEPPRYAEEDVVVYRHKDDSQRQCVVLARHHGQLVYFYAGLLDDGGRLFGRQFAHGFLTPTLKQSVPPVVGDSMMIVIFLASVFLAWRNVRLARD